MERRAYVVEELGAGRARVRVERIHACSGECGSCHGCPSPNAVIEAEVENPVGARRGDTVALEAPQRLNLWAALTYLLPVVLMIGFYFIPAPKEGVRIALSILGLLAGVGICRFVVRRARAGTLSMTITRVIPPQEGAGEADRLQ